MTMYKDPDPEWDGKEADEMYDRINESLVDASMRKGSCYLERIPYYAKPS